MGNSSTIDRLAINVSAATENAAQNVLALSKALETLAGTLGPAEASLKTLSTTLNTVRAAAPALKTAMKANAQVMKQNSSAVNQLETAIKTYQAVASRVVDPLSPDFEAQIKNARGQLATMESQLKRLSRNTIEAFDATQIKRYSNVITQAKANLDRLTMSHKYASAISKGSIAPIASGAFNTTPILNSAKAMQYVNTATKNMATTVRNAGTQLGVLGRAAQAWNTRTVKTVKHNKLLGSSFIQLRSNLFFLFFAIKGVKWLLGSMITGAMEYSEQMHLFGTVMGDGAEAANDYANAITSVLGLDPVKFKETYATFSLMSQTLGLGAETADKMSRNLTQLTYDYASLKDMTFEEVSKKFESALSGQTRAVYRFGLDITQASLQQELYREGLTANISELTKAQKAVLSVNLMVRQSTIAQGDLAKTLAQPANMLRVVKDQFAILGRTIGYFFMPMIQTLLPWLITLANALTKVAQSMLMAFGISVPSFEEFIGNAGGGTDDLYDNLSGVDDALGGAAANAKKLRDYVMGIDELNIITETDTGSGSTGGSVGSGINIEPIDVYDMIGGAEPLLALTEPIIQKLKEVAQVFAPFISALRDTWEALKPFVANVWAGFKGFYEDVMVPLGLWTMNTLGVATLERLTAVLEWFNEHPGTAKAIGNVLGAVSGIVATFKVGKLLGITGAFSSFFSFLSGDVFTILSASGIGDVTTRFGLFLATLNSGGGIVEALSAAFGPFITTIATTIAGLGWWLVLIAAVIAALVAVVVYWDEIKIAAKDLWNKLKEAWDGIYEKTKSVWDGIVFALSEAWNLIKAVVLIPLSIIGTVIITVWDTIKAATKKAWNYVYDKIEEPLNNIKNWLLPIFDDIKTKVREVWDGLADGLSAVWGNIKSIFKTGANSLIDSINNGPIKILNKIINAAKSFDKTGLMDHVSTVRLIPKLEAGGIPSVGQMFIAGEAGAELIGDYNGRSTVMPLENSGFVEAMASAVFSATSAAIQATQSENVGSGDVYIDGVKAGKIIKNSTTRAGIGGGLVSVGASGV